MTRLVCHSVYVLMAKTQIDLSISPARGAGKLHFWGTLYFVAHAVFHGTVERCASRKSKRGSRIRERMWQMKKDWEGRGGHRLGLQGKGAQRVEQEGG